MKIKLKIVLLSHLSDSKIDKENRDIRIEFIKYLILKYTNTNIEIDPEKEFENFSKIA